MFIYIMHFLITIFFFIVVDNVASPDEESSENQNNKIKRNSVSDFVFEF